MRMMKRLINSKFSRLIVASLLKIYINAVYATSRLEVRGYDAFIEAVHSDKPIICVMWHGRLAFCPKLWPKKGGRMHCIVSNHKDGEFIATLLERYNYHTIRGSSGKKGRLQAVRESLKILKKGENLSITPDGPRGPRMRINSAVVELAKRSGALMVPVTYSVKKASFLSSWDRFLFPLPFNRGIVYYGTPIHVDASLEPNEAQAIEQALEQELNAVTQSLDTHYGHPLIAPAE